jgi:hypothetical protein
MSQFTTDQPSDPSLLQPQQNQQQQQPGMPGVAMANPIGRHGMGGALGTPADTAISSPVNTQ